MISPVLRLAAILLCAAALLSAPPAFAAHSTQAFVAEERLAQGIGPDQAAAIVRDRTGGRVLGVRAVERDGQIFYQVKVLKNGHVRTYLVDGRSGNILG